jgi:hypothetical protein
MSQCTPSTKIRKKEKDSFLECVLHIQHCAKHFVFNHGVGGWFFFFNSFKHLTPLSLRAFPHEIPWSGILSTFPGQL